MQHVIRPWLAILCLALAGAALSAPASATTPAFGAARVYDPGGTARASPTKPAALHRQQEQAAQALARACDSGDQAACTALGAAYASGHGVPQNRSVAAVLFQAACDSGLGEACTRLGALTDIAINPPAKAEAVALFERACQLGDPAGCLSYAERLHSGQGIAPDPVEAKALAQRTCEQGAEAACLTLALWLAAPEATDAEYWQGQAMLDDLCQTGNATACEHYLKALQDQPAPDPATVSRYLHLSCMAGNGDDCATLGDRAWSGTGMPADQGYAAAMYAAACNLKQYHCAGADAIREFPANAQRCAADDPAACVEIGLAHAIVGTVLFDPERAVSLLASACERGEQRACETTADLLHERLRPLDAEREALHLAVLDRSCSGGESWHCVRWAVELSRTEAPEQDMARVVALLSGHCDKGDLASCSQLETMAGLIPEAPISLADGRYTPPESEADLAARFAERQAEAQERTARACTETDITFRGQRYRDRICSSAHASINGYRVRPGQAPWQALLWRPARLNGMELSGADRVLCGGALIAQGWILTAAHCLIDQDRSIAGRDYRIRLGVYNPREKEGVSYPIQQIFPHPSFDLETYAFDIALVQYNHRGANREGPVNSIARIALDPQGMAQRAISKTMDVFTYGWGWTVARDGQTTDHLRGVQMKLETPSTCNRITGFTGLRKDAALCAGGEGGEQACKGDSGGALVYYGDRDRVAKVIGVVSSGRKCGTRGEPSRYTRVAKVRAWIDGILRANGAR